MKLMLLALIATAQAHAATIMDCSNNYVGSTLVTEDNGYLTVKLGARGFNSTHPLAHRLDLPAREAELKNGQFMIPRSDCEFGKNAGHFNCESRGVLITFTGRDGTVHAAQVDKLEVRAGVIGTGLRSYQSIFYDMTFKGHLVDHFDHYGVSSGKICGREAE